MALLGKKAEETSAKGKKINKKKLPVKRSLNLAGVLNKKLNWGIGIPAILVILALAAAFGKFAVLDRLNAVSEAEGRAAQVRTQLDAAYERMDSFSTVADEYAHYTYSGMTEEELSRVDRVAIIDLFNRVVLPRASLNYWSVSGNVMRMNVTGGSLQEINMMARALEEEDMVEFCTVSTAETDDQYPSYSRPVTDETDETDENAGVTANLMVYLTPVGEEGSGN